MARETKSTEAVVSIVQLFLYVWVSRLNTFQGINLKKGFAFILKRRLMCFPNSYLFRLIIKSILVLFNSDRTDRGLKKDYAN